jgi:dolichyl-phosphate-mannose-protein mannosyltransferase
MSGIMIAPPGSMLANKIFRSFNLSGWRRAAIGIFTVAFVSRGAFVLVLMDGFYFPDAIDYSRVAVSLLADGEFGETYHRPPVYPLFLAGNYAILGQTILAIRMVEALFGACAAVVIALIAKRTAGEEVGALAGLLWSVYPTGIFIAPLGLCHALHGGQRASGVSARERDHWGDILRVGGADGARRTHHDYHHYSVDGVLAAHTPPSPDKPFSPSTPLLNPL